MCVGEPHEEVMKTDYPDQYQRPNVETHEGGQNRNKLKVTTEALTTTSTSSPEYYVYGGDDTDGIRILLNILTLQCVFEKYANAQVKDEIVNSSKVTSEKSYIFRF